MINQKILRRQLDHIIKIQIRKPHWIDGFIKIPLRCILGVPSRIEVRSEIGDAVGGLFGNAMEKANQEGGSAKRRPTGKAAQHGSGSIVYKTQPYPVNLKQISMMGGSSPLLLTTNSSFYRVQF